MKRKNTSKVYVYLILFLVIILAVLIILRDGKNGFGSNSRNELNFTQLTLPSADCEVTDFDEAIVANSDSALESLQESRLSRCYDFSSWDIDFSSETLLGRRIEVNGCSYELEKRVVRNDIIKRVTFEVEMDIEEGCDSNLLKYYDFIVIDKVPADYKIAFEPEEI